MNIHALHHEPKSRYAYPFDEHTLHLRFKSEKNDLKGVTAIAFDPYSYVPNGNGEWTFDLSKRHFIEMTKEHSDQLYDYWFCEIDHIESLRIRYAFQLTDDKQAIFYGPYTHCTMAEYETIAEQGNQYYNFPFINAEDVYQAPSWVKDSIWYQIFPERFHRSEQGPDLNDLMPWASEEVVSNEMVFGGNLHGIIEKLDYLQTLGITGIYFTPLFTSPTTHKYDTSDYFKIDPAFGDNETLHLMVQEAHKRGIKVMLDGVFNHCGYYHPYWQNVLEKGQDSPYYDCFHIQGEEILLKDENKVFSEPTAELISDTNYRMFGTAPNMPKWNTANEKVREHLIRVGTYWIQEYDIDGWRLDVSNEVSHDFWRDFRKAVKNVKADAYIIGENWDNSYPWVTGDQFDGVMNYELLNVILNFIGVQDIRTSYGVEAFANELSRYMVNYPKNILPNMFNMMDSHDTARVMTVCGGDYRKVQLVYLLQFLMPGAPSILYGSEIGLEGNFESARGCMVFEEQLPSKPMYRFLKALIKLRKSNAVFKALDYQIQWMDEKKKSLMMKKQEGHDTLLVWINNSPDKQVYPGNGDQKAIEVPGFGFYATINDQEILTEFVALENE